MLNGRMRLDQPPPPPPPPAPAIINTEGPCQCQAFLDPFPNPANYTWRLQHYCRVCNTQLNSCKQTRIHVEGKKHEKRLSHLKYSLETSDNPASSYQPGQYGSSIVNGINGQVGSMLTAPLPNMYSYPPPCPTYPTPTYYYPNPSIPNYSNQNYASYTDYAPPSTASAAPSLPATPQQRSVGGHPPHQPPHPNPNTSTAHGVMSPSLTSGFSGSGDCKSTETCSLVSVASYNSAVTHNFQLQSAESSESQNEHVPSTRGIALRGVQGRESGQQSGGPSPRPGNHVRVPGNRVRVKCEVCNVLFPSRSVLEHHLIGTRHSKKVKALNVLRKLQENGVEFRAHVPTGDIRCEVCEVSVNSSHQLQAHMSGHKHKVKCAKQGVKSTQAVLSPFTRLLTPGSSTTPSSTPSEASAPVRSYSILVGRPKFGSRPNLYQSGRNSQKTVSPRSKLSFSKLSCSKLSNGKLSHGKLHRNRLSTSGGKLSSKVSTASRLSNSSKLSTHSRLSNASKLSAGSKLSSGSSSKLAGSSGKSATSSKLKSRKNVRQVQHKSQESQQDSTTESDESGVQKLDELVERGQQTVEQELQQAEESDEAKESECEGSPKADPPVERKNSEGQHAKSSQTEPVRRLSGSEPRRGTQGSSHSEPRRSASGSNLDSGRKYGSCYSLPREDGQRRRSRSTGEHLTYWCAVCQISLNSKSQLSQHQSSGRHRQRHRGSFYPSSYPAQACHPSCHQLRGSCHQVRASCLLPSGMESVHPFLTKGDRVVRDIPMLNMFLQRLQQHHYFPPIRDEEEVEREIGR